MQVVAYDPYAKTMPSGCERANTLPGLLSRADVISLHCPLTDDNRGMINADTLAYCKRNAITVNTARGGLINDEAPVTRAEGWHLAQRGTRQLYLRAADRPEPVADRR